MSSWAKKRTQICCSCSSNFQMPGWGWREPHRHLPAWGSRLSLLPATVSCPWRGMRAPKALGFNPNHHISGPILPQQTLAIWLNAGMLQTSQISPKSQQSNRQPSGRRVAITQCYHPGGCSCCLQPCLPACLHLQQREGFVKSSQCLGWAFFIPGCSYVDILSCATGSSAAC